MKREAFKMFLKSGYEKEYERRHAAIWPELKKMLSDGGVYDYSIYWDKEAKNPRKIWVPTLLYKNGETIWQIL